MIKNKKIPAKVDRKNGKKREKETREMIEFQESIKGNLPKCLEDLSLVERGFIQRYVTTRDAQKSFKDTMDSMQLYYPVKLEERQMIINNILMKPQVKTAEKELRNLLVSEANNLFADAGLAIAKDFHQIAHDQKALKRVEDRIARYDELIEAAIRDGKPHEERALMNEQLAFEKSRNKLVETIRKNAALVNDVIGDSKQKQIIKAGAININVGGGNNGPKIVDPIDVTPTEMINIEELE